MLLITPISPNFKGLKCSVFGRFRALQSRKNYGTIGQRIKQVRRSRDMTQERLAEALSVSVGYISQIERGVTKINLDTLAAVAAHLNCELSELVTGVSVLQGRYLEGELAQLVDQMDGRQRKMLLEVAKLILAE